MEYILNEDFKDFIRAFNNQEVEYSCWRVCCDYSWLQSYYGGYGYLGKSNRR
jgi:exonuclease III